MCDIEKESHTEKKSHIRPTLLSIVIISIAVLAVFAILVHWLSPKVPSLITADGMLSYIGSGISSVATILLAIIAYRQTERANSMADKLALQSNRFAEQANELSKQANRAANKANDLAEESYRTAQQSNDLAAQSNAAAQKSNELAAQANEAAKKSNELAVRSLEIAAKSNELATQSNKTAEQSNELARLSIQASQQANELTKQANETSDRVLKLEEEQFKMEIRPFFLVTDWGVCKTVPAEFEDKHRTIAYQVGTDTDRTDNRVVLIPELTNTTQSYEMVRYSNAISSNGKRWGLCVSDRNGISLGIPAGESRKFCFYSDESFFSDIEGKTVSFEFVLENRFDERYKESFDLVVIRFNWERKDCNISPQKYEIQAFTKDCGLVPG